MLLFFAHGFANITKQFFLQPIFEVLLFILWDQYKMIFAILKVATGIPQVRISHTVPVQPWVWFLWVAGMVFDKTHSANGTHNYYALNLIQVMLKTKLIYMQIKLLL